jgi:hypothetical protein
MPDSMVVHFMNGKAVGGKEGKNSQLAGFRTICCADGFSEMESAVREWKQKAHQRASFRTCKLNYEGPFCCSGCAMIAQGATDARACCSRTHTCTILRESSRGDSVFENPEVGKACQSVIKKSQILQLWTKGLLQ